MRAGQLPPGPNVFEFSYCSSIYLCINLLYINSATDALLLIDTVYQPDGAY